MMIDTNATPNMTLRFVPKESSVAWICVVDEVEVEVEVVGSTFFLFLRFDGVVVVDPKSLDFTSLELSPITCNYNVNISSSALYV